MKETRQQHQKLRFNTATVITCYNNPQERRNIIFSFAVLCLLATLCALFRSLYFFHGATTTTSSVTIATQSTPSSDVGERRSIEDANHDVHAAASGSTRGEGNSDGATSTLNNNKEKKKKSSKQGIPLSHLLEADAIATEAIEAGRRRKKEGTQSDNKGIENMIQERRIQQQSHPPSSTTTEVLSSFSSSSSWLSSLFASVFSSSSSHSSSSSTYNEKKDSTTNEDQRIRRRTAAGGGPAVSIGKLPASALYAPFSPLTGWYGGEEGGSGGGTTVSLPHILSVFDQTWTNPHQKHRIAEYLPEGNETAVREEVASRTIPAPFLSSSKQNAIGRMYVENLLAIERDGTKGGGRRRVRRRQSEKGDSLTISSSSSFNNHKNDHNYNQPRHPDIGKPCGPALQQSDTGKGRGGNSILLVDGYSCRYYSAPGDSVQCCCTMKVHRSSGSSYDINLKAWSTSIGTELVDAEVMQAKDVIDTSKDVIDTSFSQKDEELHPTSARPAAGVGRGKQESSSIDSQHTSFRTLRPLRMNNDPHFTCFPSFVIAGAQKAGTTALMAYLLHHPSILPAGRKEVHFYDKILKNKRNNNNNNDNNNNDADAQRVQSLLRSYLKHMPPMFPPPPQEQSTSSSSSSPSSDLSFSANDGGAKRNGAGIDSSSSSVLRGSSGSSSNNDKNEKNQEIDPDSEQQEENEPYYSYEENQAVWERYISSHVTTEASPAYMLGVNFAKQIHTLFPYTRVVVILRDPVDRAYSEYSMKARRIVTQKVLSDPHQMKPVIHAVSACFARGYAPLTALLRRTIHLLGSRTYIGVLRSSLAALASSDMIHNTNTNYNNNNNNDVGMNDAAAGMGDARGGEGGGSTTTIIRGRLEAAYGIASEQGGEGVVSQQQQQQQDKQQPPFPDDTPSEDLNLRLAIHGIPHLDPFKLWFLPNENDDEVYKEMEQSAGIRGGKSKETAATTTTSTSFNDVEKKEDAALLNEIWESIFLPLDSFLTEGPPYTPLDIAKQQRRHAHSLMKNKIRDVWHSFLTRIRVLDADPLLNGALESLLQFETNEGNEGGGEDKEKESADTSSSSSSSSLFTSAANLRAHAAVDAVKSLFQDFWDEYAQNVTSSCLQQDVLSLPQVSPLQRMGSVNVQAVRNCVVARGGPGEKVRMKGMRGSSRGGGSGSLFRSIFQSVRSMFDSTSPSSSTTTTTSTTTLSAKTKQKKEDAVSSLFPTRSISGFLSEILDIAVGKLDEQNNNDNKDDNKCSPKSETEKDNKSLCGSSTSFWGWPAKLLSSSSLPITSKYKKKMKQQHHLSSFSSSISVGSRVDTSKNPPKSGPFPVTFDPTFANVNPPTRVPRLTLLDAALRLPIQAALPGMLRQGYDTQPSMMADLEKQQQLWYASRYLTVMSRVTNQSEIDSTTEYSETPLMHSSTMTGDEEDDRDTSSSSSTAQLKQVFEEDKGGAAAEDEANEDDEKSKKEYDENDWSVFHEEILQCFTLPQNEKGDITSATGEALKPVYETVPPLLTVLEKESLQLSACSTHNIAPGAVRQLLGIHAPSSSGSSSSTSTALKHPEEVSEHTLKRILPQGPRSILQDGREGCWPLGSTSNIAVDFLYRGIYLPQLQRLYETLGEANVLVLSDTQLRNEPQQVMNLLADFVGIARIDVTKIKTLLDESGGSEGSDGRDDNGQGMTDPLTAALEAAYPSFGKRTGWKLKGGYEPMSEDIKNRLIRFYAPYNRALYEYLGRDFKWKT